MSHDGFILVLSRVGSYLPTEEIVVPEYNRLIMMSSDAIVSDIKSNDVFWGYVEKYRSYLSGVISDLPDEVVGKDLISFLDKYYPSIIRDVRNDVGSRKVNLVKEVILKLIQEVRFGAN
jgi:hypothetical protein